MAPHNKRTASQAFAREKVPTPTPQKKSKALLCKQYWSSEWAPIAAIRQEALRAKREGWWDEEALITSDDEFFVGEELRALQDPSTIRRVVRSNGDINAILLAVGTLGRLQDISTEVTKLHLVFKAPWRPHKERFMLDFQGLHGYLPNLKVLELEGLQQEWLAEKTDYAEIMPPPPFAKTLDKLVLQDCCLLVTRLAALLMGIRFTRLELHDFEPSRNLACDPWYKTLDMLQQVYSRLYPNAEAPNDDGNYNDHSESDIDDDNWLFVSQVNPEPTFIMMNEFALTGFEFPQHYWPETLDYIDEDTEVKGQCAFFKRPWNILGRLNDFKEELSMEHQRIWMKQNRHGGWYLRREAPQLLGFDWNAAVRAGELLGERYVFGR